MTRTRPRDEGAALVLTMMVVVLVTVLTTTILRVTTDDLGSARRARDAGAALDAADAGLAQAQAYLRTNGPHGLRCSPACTTNPWGNSTSPATAALPGLAGQSYRVWIEPIARFPENDPGRYRIHSEGRVGGGARSVRRVELDVYLSTRGTGVPLGLFGRTLEGGGDYTLARASIFSTGCVYNRAQIEFTAEVDAAYGIRTGVHSSETITESNGNNGFCGDTNKTIHETSPCGPTKNPGGERRYRFDHDLHGGPLGATDCAEVAAAYPAYYGERDLDGDTVPDVVGTRLRSKDALLRLFGIAEEPFTPAQLDDLRAVARSQTSHGQDHHWTTATGFATPDPVAHPHSVLFFDLLGTPDEGKIVDLKDLSAAWDRPENLAADSPQCESRSLLTVVSGGNVRLNSDHRMAASVVLTSSAPYGKVLKHNGTADMIGTVYGDSVDLAGTAELSLDQCFISNLNPNLLGFETKRYLEVDRG